MKKILLLLLAVFSFTASGQERGILDIKIDVNRELYPLYEDDTYMSSDSNAIIGVTYLEKTLNQVATILDVMESQMNIQNPERVTLSESKTPGYGVMGIVIDELGQEMFMELYIIEVNNGEGVIFIMSSYKLADKDIYGAEGRKATLSAVIDN